jgi:hypothetical protein
MAEEPRPLGLLELLGPAIPAGTRDRLNLLSILISHIYVSYNS